MDKIDDLPDPPPPSEQFDAPAGGGGYLSGNDDDEVRKITARTSGWDKLLILVVLAGLGGTGYYMWRTAQHDAAVERANREGRAALDRILQQPIPQDQIAAQVRAAYQQYKSGPEFRMAARRILARVHDAAAMPIFIEGLQESGRERQQAALGVAEIGMPAAVAAREALNTALPHTNPTTDRAEVAWAMVVAEDPRAWNTVVELLGSGRLQQITNLDDPPRRVFDAALVARMAGHARLVQLASDTHVPVRRIAAVSLAELASAEVFDTLVRLSQDRDADVAREAAIGLGRTGLDRAGDAIVAFLNTHPDARDAVLNALSQNAGAPGLAPVMRSATDPTIRSQATRLLRELQDPGAGDAFMAVLGQVPADATDEVQRNIRKHAIFGLAEIGDARAAEGLMELVQRPLVPGARVDPNADMDARLALDALRKIPNACVTARATLLQILPRADFMRTQLLLALGQTGDASLAPQMMVYLRDVNAQEGAAVAIARLNYAPGIAQIRTDARRPPTLNMAQETVQDEAVFISRRNAIRALAWTHNPIYAVDLERIIEDPNDRNALREEAGHALASIADDHTIDDIATRALDTTKPEVTRLFYLYALRGRSNPATSNRLIEAYLRPGTPAGIMHAAAIAAGFGGDDTTAAALRPLITSEDPNVQLNSSIAAVICGDEATGRVLVQQLIDHHDLAELLSNTFVTRSATGNNTGVQLEPLELTPVTQSMFQDGRIHRRINMATLLERGRGAQHFDFAMVWLRIRIKTGWESPIGIGPFEIRAALREAANGSDAFRSDMSFKMFRSLNDRGSLLWLRRQTGPAAERARRELVEMNGNNT